MKTLIKNIGLLATPVGSAPRAAQNQGEITYHENCGVLSENGIITEIFSMKNCPCDADNVIDAHGALVTPGLVDSHTHLVFGGWREHEVPLKLKGATYLEILEGGGGIVDTCRNTRSAIFSQLLVKSKELLKQMTALGVTSLEVKSGYGLNLVDEIKQLEVVRSLRRSTPLDIVPTFMGAHATPPEYAGRTSEYVDYIVDTVLPHIHNDDGDMPLATFCDVFCEKGVFDVEQSRKVLTKAKEYGMTPKIHADEIEVIGAVPLAVEMGAISADHLIAIDENGINSLANSQTVATLLPSTSFYLDKGFAPARRMIEKGVAIAVASDFNPGSCPSFNLQLSMNLAYLKYRMTPEEVLTAVTLNAACAIGMGNIIGTLEVGKQADMVIWDATTLSTLVYRMGGNLAKTVIKKGEIVAL